MSKFIVYMESSYSLLSETIQKYNLYLYFKNYNLDLKK